MTIYSHLITDQDLINAAHPSTTTGKPFNAIYRDGTAVVFHVEHSRAAAFYAREYGERFLGGTKVVSVRLLK